MTIRRYTKSDIPDLVTHLRDGLSLYHYRAIKFDAGKVEDTLVGNLSNPGFFMDVYIADDGEIGGGLCGFTAEYAFSREAYAEHMITYMREGYRNLSAITGLVSSYIHWAKSRGVRQIRWGQSTGFKMDKFAALAKRRGFTQIGTTWSMENKA